MTIILLNTLKSSFQHIYTFLLEIVNYSFLNRSKKESGYKDGMTNRQTEKKKHTHTYTITQTDAVRRIHSLQEREKGKKSIWLKIAA